MSGDEEENAEEEDAHGGKRGGKRMKLCVLYSCLFFSFSVFFFRSRSSPRDAGADHGLNRERVRARCSRL
eukprot:374031-Rhodomonas_salina.1